MVFGVVGDECTRHRDKKTLHPVFSNNLSKDKLMGLEHDKALQSHNWANSIGM